MHLKTISTKGPDEMVDSLEALAHRLGTRPAELVRRFIEAGLAANNVSEPERAAARARRGRRERQELPGLVVPTTPLAAAGASGSVAEVHCLADWAAGQAEGRRWRDSNPRCASPAPRRIRKTRAA